MLEFVLERRSDQNVEIYISIKVSHNYFMHLSNLFVVSKNSFNTLSEGRQNTNILAPQNFQLHPTDTCQKYQLSRGQGA